MTIDRHRLVNPCVLLTATLLLVTAPWGHARMSAAEVADQIRALTLQRADRAPDALRRDEVLADIARGHSRTMSRRGRLAHIIDGTGPADRLARHHRSLFGLVSENVAMRDGDRNGAGLARHLVTGWMNSPPHRDNILADYELFEVGCHGDEGSSIYCTQLFVREADRLRDAVNYHQRAGSTIELQLQTDDQGGAHRIGITPAGADAAPSSQALVQGRVQLRLPSTTGEHQLELWTQTEPEGGRYRIVPGPLVCLRPTGSAAEEAADCRP